MNDEAAVIRQKTGLNAFVLKLIAAAAMLSDHVAYVFLDGNYAVRAFGRLAFPIFAFFVAEGYRYTKDVKKYAVRMLVFALIAQAPYALAFGKPFYEPNVIFTLLLALLAVWAFDKGNEVVKVSGFIAAAVLAELTGSDHGAFGVVMVFLFFIGTDMKKKLMSAGILILLVTAFAMIQIHTFSKYALMYLFYLAPLVLIYFYNGKRGPHGFIPRWFFYIFYPLHLLIIALINIFV